MISNLNKSSAVDPTQSQSDPLAVKSRKGTKKTEDGSQDDVTGLGETGDSFISKLQKAGAVPSNAVATQPTTVNLSKEALNLGLHAEAQGKDQSQKPLVAVNRQMESASFSPLTAKASAGVNAGSSIAGLKPWNQDWVLEGLDQPTPENADNAFIRPLVGGKSAMDEFGEAQKALSALRAQAMNEDETPGATQVTNLRTRGEEGQLKDALSSLLSGEQGANDAAMPAVNARLASQLSQQLGGGGVSQQVSSQDLSQAMAQLNGKILNTGSRTQGPDLLQNPVANKLGGVGGKGAQDLSGGEFLNTLTLVKPGQQALNGDTVEAIGTRPAIQISQFEGGRKKSSGFPEDSISNRMLSSEMIGKSGQGFTVPTAAVIGHVVPGAMAQDQLSHEAVLNVSNGIKGLGQGVGEMKIHLKPDNLGELHLKVMTRGQEVGIQILASDENAKKVIQDSMSTLKDGLASQNLTLGKVELAVARSFGAENSQDQSGNSSNSQSQQHSQNQFSSHFGAGQNANQQNQGNRWTGNDSGDEVGTSSQGLKMGSAQAAAARLAMASGGGRNGASVNDGRLDVLA
jgi:flagellar hook-length control protein FliK